MRSYSCIMVMEMTTLLTPNLVLTAALPVLSDRRISVKKTLLRWLNSFWLRKLSWRTQLSFPPFQLAKSKVELRKRRRRGFQKVWLGCLPFPDLLLLDWSKVDTVGGTLTWEWEGPRSWRGLLRTTRSQVPALRGLRWQQHSSSRGGNISSLIWRMEALVSDRSI